jgi:hypothetical protein
VHSSSFVGRLPTSLPPSGGKKGKYGVPPEGRVKLNRNNIKLYQLGVPNSNIPTLTRKHFRSKCDEYVDQFYTAQDLDYTSCNFSLTGVIDTVNGINEHIFKPTTRFNKNFVVSPVGKWLGEWFFLDPQPEIEGEYDYKRFRRQLIKEVEKSGRAGKRGDLCDYISKLIVEEPHGLYCRMTMGQVECSTGIYTKCNQCGCLSRLPVLFVEGYVDAHEDEEPKPKEGTFMTKDDVCDLIEAVENRRFHDGEFITKAEVAIDFADQIAWMLNLGSIHCYNCGWHLSDASHVLVQVHIFNKITYGDYGINKLSLEEFLKCLRLDNPPPEDLPRALKQYDISQNIEVSRVLSRMKANFSNMYYNLSAMSTELLNDEFTTLNVMTNQRLSDEYLSEIEMQEIMLLHETSIMFGGAMIVHPSTINTYHALYDIIDCIPDSSWFQRCGFRMLTNITEAHAQEILSASNDSEIILTPGSYILHINTNADNDWWCEKSTLYTACSGSSVPVKWNRQLCEQLSKSVQVMIDGKKHPLRTIRATPLLCITYIDTEVATDDIIRVMRGKSRLQVLLPTIDLNSIFKTLGIFGTRWEWQTIDVEMVHRLLIFGLSGEKSMNSMLVYMAGLTTTRYSAGGKLVDLTSLSVKDGLPELLYVLLILSNNRRLMAWCQLNYVTIDANNLSETIYQLVISRCLQSIKLSNKDLFNSIEELITNKTQMLYKRDFALLSKQITVNVEELQPYKYITSSWDGNFTNGMTACKHLHNRCDHNGDYNCLCCGLSTNNTTLMCSCCANTVIKTNHVCEHKCKGVDSHICEERRKTGMCHHYNACPCCKMLTCHQVCKCCYDEESLATIIQQISIKPELQHRKKPIDHARSDSRSQPAESKPTKVLGISNKNKQQTLMGKRINDAVLGEEKVKVKTILNLDKDSFFHISYNNETHCLYKCLMQRQLLMLEPLTSKDIVDVVDVQSMCLLHCIERQTDLSITQLVSITGYKEEGNLLDLENLCDYYKLNVLVQVNEKTGYIYRYGNLLDKYILIAHQSSILDSDRQVGHWCIPSRVHLSELPNGLWDNSDYSAFSLPEEFDRDIFKMNQDEYLAFAKKLRSYVTNTALHQLTFPIIPLVKEGKGEFYLCNSNVDNLIGGQINIKLPNAVVDLATAVFNVEKETMEEVYTTSFITKDMPLDEMIIERLKSALRNVGIFMREIRNNTAVIKASVDIDATSNILQLPIELRTYKSLEFVQLEDVDGNTTITLTGKNKNVVLIENKYVEKLRTIRVFKQSFSSLLRGIHALSRAWINIPNLSSVNLKFSQLGVGGAGKTWSLAHNIGDIKDVVYVCKFKTAVDEQQEKGWKQVRTLESAQTTVLKTHKLAIDEAAAIDVLDVIALLNVKNMQLFLTGDSKQISSIDFTQTPGLRMEISAIDYFGVTVEALTESHRYGEPLLSDVISRCYEKVSKAEDVTWSTEYRVEYVSSLDGAVQLIKDNNIDAIFNFYDETYHYLGIELSSSVRHYKVHADQGQQADRVAVMYWSPTNAMTGILSNSQYLTTAVTRPRTYLLWITNIPSLPQLGDIFDYAVKGKGNVFASPIDTTDIRLTRPLNENDRIILARILSEKIENIEKLLIEIDSIRIIFKYNNLRLDVTIDSESIRGNDIASTAALMMNRKKLQHLLEKIDFNIVDESSDDYNILKQATNMRSVSYKLTTCMWTRLVQLADACLINQRGMCNLKLNTPLGMLKVTIFNGCSVFAGFKFEWMDGTERKVIISSGHVNNGETVWTMIAAHVRSFYGEHSDVVSIRMLLSDQMSTTFPPSKDNYLLSRITERLVNIVKQKTLNVSGIVADAGNFYAEVNRKLTNQMQQDIGVTQKIVEHQETNILLYTTEYGAYTYPTRVPVKDINTVMLHLMGVAGVEDYPVSLATKQKMDAMLEKRVIAEYTEMNLLYLPKAQWKRWGYLISSVVNDRNVREVSQPMVDDTVAPIANAIALNYVKTMMKKSSIDVHGMDVVTLTMLGMHDYRLRRDKLKRHECQYLENCVVKLLEKEQTNVLNMSGVEKSRAEQRLLKLRTTGAYTRLDDQADTLLLGLGSNFDGINFSQYKEVILVDTDLIDEAVIMLNKKKYLMGDQSRYHTLPVSEKHCVTVTKLGPFSIKTIVIKETDTVIWNSVTTFGMRKFMLEGTNLPVVQIPRVIFTKLISRAMIEDIKIGDLLAYCRSVASTVIYSSSGMYKRYKLNNNDLVLYCVVVMNIARRHRKYYETVHKLFESANSDLKELLTDTIKNKVISAIYEYVTQSGIIDYVKELGKWKQNVGDKSLLDEFIKAISDKDVTEIHTLNKLIIKEKETTKSSDVREDEWSMKLKKEKEKKALLTIKRWIKRLIGKRKKKTKLIDKWKSFIITDEDTDSDDDVYPKENDDGDDNESMVSNYPGVGAEEHKEIEPSGDVSGREKTRGHLSITELNNAMSLLQTRFRCNLISKSITRIRSQLSITELNNAMLLLQTRFRYNLISKGITKHECDQCPLMTRAQCDDINNFFKDKFLKLVKLMDEEKVLGWQLTRGTLLAALYYGKMYMMCNKFQHYVDGDIDIVIYVNSQEKKTKLQNKLKTGLQSNIVYNRGEVDGSWDIMLFKFHNIYSVIDCTRCVKMHPLRTKDRLITDLGLDIAIIVVQNQEINIRTKKLSEQLGAQIGVYDWESVRPSVTTAYKFYGIPVMLPKNASIPFKLMADTYRSGDYKQLSEPWWPGIETAGSVHCGKILPRHNYLTVLKTLKLLTNIPNHFETFRKMVDVDCRKAQSIAIMLAGSKGDIVPLLNFAGALHEKYDITVYKPSDVQVDRRYKTINYIDSYKQLIHGNGEADILKHLTESLNRTENAIYDYVVGTHFSRELSMIKARKYYIRLYPLLEVWENTVIEKSLKWLGLMPALDNHVNTLRFNCVPSVITNLQYHNIGWPICKEVLQPLRTDVNLIDNCDYKEKQYTLITFGSMGMNSEMSTIQNILNMTDGMVIWVRGYTNAVGSLKYKGEQYDQTVDQITTKLSIVQEMNYHYMCKYIKHVHCHGGAGTMLCFWYNRVPMTIKPQAYDQKFNAKWYLNNIDNAPQQPAYDNEWKNFKQSLSLIGFSTVRDNLLNPKVKMQLFTNKPLDTYGIKKYIVEYEVIDATITRSDCVLKSTYSILNDTQYKRYHEAYEKFTSIKSIITIADVMLISLLSKTTIMIIDKQTGILYTNSNTMKMDKAILIDIENMHASIAKITKAHKCVSEMNNTTIAAINTDENRVRVLMDIICILNKRPVIYNVLISNQMKQLQSLMRVNLENKWLTMMRQREQLILITGKRCHGFYIPTNASNIIIWRVYLCLTELGIFMSIAIKLPSVGTVLLHGQNSAIDVTCIVPMNTLISAPVTTKLQLPISSAITAVNVTTKMKCNEMGIPVSTILAEEFTTLYVYNTQNRKHHLEKERDAILSAKHIIIPTMTIDKMTELQLRNMRLPRAILIGGNLRHAIEPVPTDDETIQVLSKISSGYWMSQDKLWVTSESNDFEHLAKLFKLIENDEWERHEIKHRMDKNISSITTIKEVFTLNKLDRQESTENFLRQAGTSSLVRITNDIKFSAKVWARATTSGTLLHFPFILIGKGMVVFEIIPTGCGREDGLQRWNDFEQLIKTKDSENKFNMIRIEHEETQMNSELLIVNAMSPAVESDAWATFEVAPELLITNKITEVIDCNQGEIEVCEKHLDDVRMVKTIDYWENFNQLQDNIIHLPQTPGFKIKSRLEPSVLGSSVKLRNELYPDYARPSMTNVYAQELNSVTTRQGSVINYVKKNLNVDDEFNLFCINYLREDFKILHKNYLQHPVGINMDATMKWTRDHNYPKLVQQNLKQLFDEGFEMNGISNIKVHGKIEQTTRMEKFSRWFTEVQTRSIMASAYCISALFSPMFLEIKKRFKDSLVKKFVYSDGMSPDQLAAHMRKHKGVKWVVEDDLSKQDAATTHLIINVEFKIYEMLGAAVIDLELYSWVHKRWRFTGKGFSGVWDAMRLTGQPTTSIGNAITNLIVHNRFVRRNNDQIICMYVLGDDNIILSNTKLNVSRHGTETKEFYNIMSKISQSQGVGQYLSMLVHVVDDIVKLSPDFKRMRHRYAVCNYTFTSAEREEKLKMRRLSYALMLGNIKQSVDYIRSNFPTVETNDWYEVNDAIMGCAKYYNVDRVEIEQDISALVNMIKSTTYYTSEMPYFQSNYKQTTNRIRIDKMKNSYEMINIGYE